MEHLSKFWPLYAAAASVLLAAGAGQMQLAAIAGEADDNAEHIEQNAEDIEALQKTIIENGGKVALEMQRQRLQQEVQEEKIDEILQLLRQQQRSP